MYTLDTRYMPENISHLILVNNCFVRLVLLKKHTDFPSAAECPNVWHITKLLFHITGVECADRSRN